jgi:hypothetical protein
MELGVAIKDGLLDPTTHRLMKMVASYVSTTYQIRQDLMDLKSAVFENVDDASCQRIVNVIKT